MAVLALFRFRGDPDDLLAAYDQELQHPTARERPHRQLHVCARGEKEMVVVDLWDSAEQFQGMMDDPEFRRNLELAGTPEPDSLDVYEVHATIP
jgi:hypothetical protein